MELKYIDFGVAPYALPDVCEALYNNGITNGFLTVEDGDIHVRWQYDINRKSKHHAKSNGDGCNEQSENNGK